MTRSRTLHARRPARGLLTTLAVAVLAALAGCSRDQPAPAPVAVREPTAAAGVVTLDTHSDIPLDFATAAVDPFDADLQNSLQKMASGGLDAAFFIVYVAQTARNDANYAQAQAEALTKFTAIHRMAEELHPTGSRSRIAPTTSRESPRAASSSPRSASRTATCSARSSSCSTATTSSEPAT
jgi:hypothetical protein